MPSPRTILRALAAAVALAGAAAPAIASTQIVPARDVLLGRVTFAPNGTAYWLTDPYTSPVRIVALAPDGKPAVVGSIPELPAEAGVAQLGDPRLVASDDRLAVVRQVELCPGSACADERRLGASQLLVGPPDGLEVVAGCGPQAPVASCAGGLPCPHVTSAVAAAGVVAASVASCLDQPSSLIVVPADGAPGPPFGTGAPRGVAGPLLLTSGPDPTTPATTVPRLTLWDWTTRQVRWAQHADDAGLGAALGDDGSVVFASVSPAGADTAVALIDPGQPPESARVVGTAPPAWSLFGYAHGRVLMVDRSAQAARVIDVATGATTPVTLAPKPSIAAFAGTAIAYRTAPCGDEWLVVQAVDGPSPPALERPCPIPAVRTAVRMSGTRARVTVRCPDDPYLSCPGAAQLRLIGRGATRRVRSSPAYLAARGTTATLTFRLTRTERRFVHAARPGRAELRLTSSGRGTTRPRVTRTTRVRIAR